MNYGGAEKLAEIDRMFREDVGVTDDDVCHDYAVRKRDM